MGYGFCPFGGVVSDDHVDAGGGCNAISTALARKVVGLLRFMSLLRLGSIDSRGTRR
jgi:hypothetical protein